MTIQTSALDSGLNEVVIEAKGYKNQSITVTVESQKADTEIEVSSVVKESSWTGDYLLIRFNGVEGEKLKTFLKEIDSVEVNGKSIARHPFPRSLEVVSLHRMQRIHLIAMIIMIV